MNLIELTGMVPVTALYAGLHGLLAVVLANFVLHVRLKGKRAPDWQPDAALRVQANFIENVPIALLLLLVLEVQGTASQVLHGFGATLFVLRLLHAYGLGTYEAANYPRLIGAQGTFVVIAAMAVGCIGTAL